MDPAPPFLISAPHSSLLHTTSATWDEQPFFDAAPYAALLLDAQGNVVKHNRSFHEICAPADEALANDTDPVKVLGVRDEASVQALRMHIGRGLIEAASGPVTPSASAGARQRHGQGVFHLAGAHVAAARC